MTNHPTQLDDTGVIHAREQAREQMLHALQLASDHDLPRVYIAAPFFNDPQRIMVSQIEEQLENEGLAYYSPRLDGVVRKDGLDAKKFFNQNVTAIEGCTLMLAVMDYVLPGFNRLFVMGTTPPDYAPREKKAGPIRQPDLGVAYEIGYANARGKPIVGFTVHPPTQVNLMLSQALTGMLTSFSMCRGWARTVVQNHYRNDLWEMERDWMPKEST